MVNQDDVSKKNLESRPPTLDDFLKLCRGLNEAHVNYIVIGGIAVIHQGFTRATEDIDLLIDNSAPNLNALREGLSKLPDQAINQVTDEDFDQYEVIRVADEIVVDILQRASGLSYEDAKGEIEWVKIEDVQIPFASAKLLLKMKQGVREKDVIDRRFLEALLQEKSK